MTTQDLTNRERYFTRRTRHLLGLEFVLGGLGFTLLKGVGVAFILLVSLVFMGGVALYFLPLAADPRTVGMALLLAFLLSHIALAWAQSRLARTGEPA